MTIVSESAVAALSKEVTKVLFMCGSEPFPNKAEVNDMLRNVLQSYKVMLDLYLVLPEEVGAQVFKATTTALLNIMTALLKVVESLKDLTKNG